MKLFLVWRYYEGKLLVPTPEVVKAESAEKAADQYYDGALVIEAQAFGIAAAPAE